MEHPWSQPGLAGQVTLRHYVLLELSSKSKTVDQLALSIQMSGSEAALLDVLDGLCRDGIARRTASERYALATPLDWHGSFDRATFEMGRKGLLIADPRDKNSPSHLFLCDVRNLKPLPDDVSTLAVTACGTSLRSAYISHGEEADDDGATPPSCDLCYAIWASNEGWLLNANPFVPRPIPYMNAEKIGEHDGEVLELLFEMEEHRYLAAIGRVTVIDDDWIEVTAVHGYPESSLDLYAHNGRIRREEILGFRKLEKDE